MRTALLSLHEHPNAQVRLKAATATLAVAPVAARQTLQRIVDAKEFPQAAQAGFILVSLHRENTSRTNHDGAQVRRRLLMTGVPGRTEECTVCPPPRSKPIAIRRRVWRSCRRAQAVQDGRYRSSKGACDRQTRGRSSRHKHRRSHANHGNLKPLASALAQWCLRSPWYSSTVHRRNAVMRADSRRAFGCCFASPLRQVALRGRQTERQDP